MFRLSSFFVGMMMLASIMYFSYDYYTDDVAGQIIYLSMFMFLFFSVIIERTIDYIFGD